MERDGDPGPDAASIKPVSSLRAKFENLQTQKQNEQDPVATKTVPASLKLAEPSKEPGLLRASLDLPRPTSPWTAQQQDGQNAPRSPAPGLKPPDFTRSKYKRPMSMQIQSSPQLTPSVQVESPKSPPRGLLDRSQSRSPDRTDTLPFGKVKDLVSQHSSKSSTRAHTPSTDRTDPIPPAAADSSVPASVPTPAARPKSPIPPIVNRADKPKIPAKPQGMSTNQESTLGARPLAFLADRKVSPFSTPPSSDEEQVPINDLDQQSPQNSSIDELRTDSEVAQSVDSINTAPRSSDPRTVGLAAARPASEWKDPRQLGFSSSAAASPAQPAQESRHTPLPARIVPLAAISVRDARELGFSPNSPLSRQAPSLTQTKRLSPARPETAVRSDSAKDARRYGFSGTASVPGTPVDAARPDLPQRATPKIPPPRPSEETKRPAYAPGISRTPAKVMTQIPASTPVRRSEDMPRRNIPAPADVRFPPPPKRTTFGDEDKNTSLEVPAPAITRRRSFDDRHQRADDSDEAEEPQPELIAPRNEYPDASHTNRRPPLIDPQMWQFNSKTDGRAVDICGNLLCTGHYHTRIFDIQNGEEVLSLNHGDTVKTTSVAFKPGADIKAEGKRIWIGNNLGDLQEIDLETHVTIHHSIVHNRVEIFKILRHKQDLWTLDEAGKLFVWQADKTGAPNMKESHISHKLHFRPTFAMVVQDTLWVASGREIRVYRPGRDSAFDASRGPLPMAPSVGDVTSGTYSDEGGTVYIGHADGKVSMYSLRDYSLLGSLRVSDYKIVAMSFIGDKLWVVYKTGKAYVYDTSTTPWRIKKDWKAHHGPATSMLLDPSSVWLLGRLQVVTTGHDGFVRLWDGMLEDDWVEARMQEKADEYCTFREVRASVTTWNCGATSPVMLNTHFIADAIHADEPNPPEILAFGFQEVVDLEDRAVTAKSILGFGKKKEKATDQQHQSRVYREWRDYLARCIRKYLPQYDYTELHTSSLIGLFSCIFIRTSERRHVSSDARHEVKCGMGGHYGNKGALLCRFILDSSSLCFVNCHLAAGQSQTAHRNNDVAAILESDGLPAEADLDVRTSRYVGGGDGSQILDHEICILNGDLNYRIDALPRGVILKYINSNNLAALLKRDQLNVSRQRVAGFRLAPFTELPLTFRPTYKYDEGTDNYDTSDKKRSPAWCDRILFRAPALGGKPRVQQLEYVRHEGVRYSDHRPVSGLFAITVKKVDDARRKKALKSVYLEFEKMRNQMLEDGCVRYLVHSFGVEREEARRLIRKAK